jgi:predicted oxidoreductase
MKTLLLGRSSLAVSRLAYGCWRLAGSEGAAPPADGDATGKRAVHAALDAGYTFFDLADIYGGGECERIFGSVLKDRPGTRDRIVVASKCGIRRLGEPAGAVGRYDFSAAYIEASVEGSLRRMGLETMDLLMLHRPDYLMDPAEVAEAFLRLRASGKVREFGVSNFRPSQVTALQRACGFPLVTHQVEVSLVHTAGLEDGTLDQCLMDGMTPTAWSPLGRGQLGDGELTGLGAAVQSRAERVRAELDVLAPSYGVSRTQLAVAWLLKHPTAMVPVVGSVNPVRIAALAKAASVEISRDDWYRLLVASRGERLP